MTPRIWTCQRVVDGVKCGQANTRIKQKCVRCGGRRPKARAPAHMAALGAMTYEQAAALFGERCGICGTAAKNQRLHRDHEHSGDGRVRGLLCFRCNAGLRNYMTADWLRCALAYVERAGAGT